MLLLPTHLRSRVRLLATALFAVSAAAACNSSDSTSPLQATVADRAYIDGMVPHHGMATLSADMAIERAVHPELKQMAQTMKADQSKEIALLTSYKKSWFGTDSVPMPMMPRDMPAGPSFDLEWMRMMITHHQGAIDMSTLRLSASGRAENDSLAQHIITEQREEIQQMRTWAKQWYGATLNVGTLP